MARLLNRCLSLAVVITYIAVMAATQPGPYMLLNIGAWIILLAFIWYGDELGGLLMNARGQVTAPSLGWLVTGVAWGLLLLPVIIYLVGLCFGNNVSLMGYIQAG